MAVLSSCASWRPKMDDSINYQRDLKVKVEYWNGKKFKGFDEFNGFGVAKMSAKYRITVYPIGKVDMVVGTNCHQDWKIKKPKTTWKDGVEILYEPNELERNKNCPLDIGIYEKKKGRHGWAMVEFEDNRLALKSETICNGSVIKYTGVSACQAKEGLVQQISFNEPVDFQVISGCMIKGNPGDNKFTYIMPEGDCSIHFCQFKKIPGDKQCLRHTMFGYQVIPIRGID